MIGLFPQLDAGSPVNKSHPLASGLVDWWMASPMGHPAYRGGSRQKHLLNQFHATLTGGPTWHGNQGRPGGWGSWKFDGTDDYLDIVQPDDVPYMSTAGLTICVWANILTGSNYRHFAGKHATNGATACPFDFRTDNAATPTLFLSRANTANHAWSGPAVTLAAWAHYAVVCASTDIGIAPTFYKNGAAATGTDNSGSGTGTVTGSNANIVLGRRPDGAVLMDGYMDDVRIYNRALSGSQMYALYENSKRGYPGLLHRVQRKFYATAAASTFQAAWGNNANSIVGVGVA